MSDFLASNGAKHPLQQTAVLHSCGNDQRLGGRFASPPPPPRPQRWNFSTSHCSFQHCIFHFEVWGAYEKKKRKKICVSFNGSLILATWFIHVATADITALINHAVRHAGRPRAPPGLTNLSAIFHLNNLALPQGRPTPDTHTHTPLEGGFPHTFIPFIRAHKGAAAEDRPERSAARVYPLSAAANNEKLPGGHGRNSSSRRLALWMRNGTQKAEERWDRCCHLIWKRLKRGLGGKGLKP